MASGRSCRFACSIVLAAIATAFIGIDNSWADDGQPTTKLDTSSASGNLTLEEVTVTARRTKEKIQDVPIAVTALGTDSLEKLGVKDVQDLSYVIPALNIVQLEPDSLVLAIRGQVNSQPKAGQDTSIGLYVNDVPYSIPQGTNLGMFDIQDVEVLKGPQGTLFGRNTTGGAVLINTNLPSDKFEGYVQAGAVTFQIGSGWKSEGVLNVPVADVLSVRFAYSAQDVGGYIKNIVSPAAVAAEPPELIDLFGPTNFQNLGGIESDAVRFSALLKPGGDFQNLLFFQSDRMLSNSATTDSLGVDPTGAAQTFAPLVGLPDPTVSYQRLQAAQAAYYWTTEATAQMPLTMYSNTVSDTATWHVSDSITLKNIVSYRQVTEKYTQDPIGLDGLFLVFDSEQGGHTETEEFQVQGVAWNGGLRWVTGLFYSHETQLYETEPIVVFNSPSTYGHSTSIADSYAVFAQGTQSLSSLVEGLSLTGGLRYTEDHREEESIREANGGTSCLFPGQTLADCGLNGSANFSKPTYTVSLDYKYDKDTLIYLATRSGYRSGGFNALPSNQAEFVPFRPEIVTDYEIGLKRDWRLVGRPFRSNIAIYYQDYEDVQRDTYLPTNATIQTIINAAKARVDGGEIELTFEPIDRLQLNYSYSLVAAVYTNFPYLGMNLAGQTFAYVPKYEQSVSVAYTLPLSRDYGVVSVNGNLHHQSFFFYDDVVQTGAPYNVLGQAPYSITKFTADWNSIWGSHFDLSGYVDNAFDAKVHPQGSVNWSSLGVGIAFFSVPPRQIGFNLRYNFGG